MDKFRQWYLTNYVEITWFLIGFLLATGLDSLARGHYFNAVLNFSIAFLNYFMTKR